MSAVQGVPLSQRFGLSPDIARAGGLPAQAPRNVNVNIDRPHNYNYLWAWFIGAFIVIFVLGLVFRPASIRVADINGIATGVVGINWLNLFLWSLFGALIVTLIVWLI